MMNCGIYCIKNLINNKIYIGKTNDLQSRWKNHLFWSTENGRIIGNVVHETNSDIGFFKSNLSLLGKYREKVTFEQTPENLKFFEYLDSLIQRRDSLGERAKKAVDKAYNHFKELYQKE